MKNKRATFVAPPPTHQAKVPESRLPLTAIGFMAYAFFHVLFNENTQGKPY